MNYIKTGLITSALLISTSANSALLSRLGGLAYYDTEADLTWLADANYAMTSGYDADGRMNWVDANRWASSLSVGGVEGWRLANSDSCYGYNCSESEMGNLFYNVLGNPSGTRINTPLKTGPFYNVQDSSVYWLATNWENYPAGYASNADHLAWSFYMHTGYQYDYNKSYNNYAWAVQSGDVGAVPLPAAAWLFGTGLIALIGLSRRKK